MIDYVGIEMSSTGENQPPQVASSFLAFQEEHREIRRHSRALIEELSSSKNLAAHRGNFSGTFANLSKSLTEHIAKEEQVLGPILSEHFDPEIRASLGQEHKEVSGALRKLDDSLAGLGSGGHLAHPAKIAAEFDSLIQAHFSLEENVVYWYASLCLGGRKGVGFGEN